MCFRTWRASSEQLQWQVADLQRKLKDSEQRSTLWARRAGAAEARVPFQATSVTRPWSQGPYPNGPAPAQTDRADSTSILTGTSNGNASTQQHTSSDEDQEIAEEHEEGCALALLQEALSAAPESNIGAARSVCSTRSNDRMGQIPPCMQLSGIPLSSSVTLTSDVNTMLAQHDDISSLKQRIAGYQTQSGFAGLPRLYNAQCNSQDGSACDDGPESPLQQRIAEYNKISQQQSSHSTLRNFPSTFASRFDSLDTNKATL